MIKHIVQRLFGSNSAGMKKALEIDGVVATEKKDAQGEILDVNGADISQMTTRGYFNDNHSQGMENTIGKITHAKKILKEEDCEDDRHKSFWAKFQKPFIYARGYLFNDEDHPKARATAAIMRAFTKRGAPLDMQASVEGKVLKRDPFDRTKLQESVIRNVALTLVPANDDSGMGILKDDKIVKSICDEAIAAGGNPEYVDTLMKGLQLQTISTNGHFTAILNPIEELYENVSKINELTKALTAGYGGAAAPASRVGGSALVAESVGKKKLTKDEKKKVLKSLIFKVKEKYPKMDYVDILERSLDILDKMEIN